MTKVRLYDPHPGFAGAAIQLPAPLKKLADSLDGKVTTLEETVKTIRGLAGPIFGKNYEVEDAEEHNFISFSIKAGQAEHYFRLIRYEEIDPKIKAAKLERIEKKKLEDERKHREETEKEVRKKLNNYKKPESIEDIPVFTGWTPSYTLHYFGFNLESRIELINIGKEVTKTKKIKDTSKKLPKVDGKYIAEKLGAEQISKGQYQVSKGRIIKVTQKELEYGRQNAGSKGLFEQKRPEVQKTFDDLNQKGIEFVVYRTYRGWPAVWDSVEFYSKPKGR